MVGPVVVVPELVVLPKMRSSRLAFSHTFSVLYLRANTVNVKRKIKGKKIQEKKFRIFATKIFF